MIEPATRPLEWSPPRTAISRVPYLPGLDGMRALAVLAVMVYHANPAWLPGGFLGVEVFFVISGYLITLLIIGEHESHRHVSLRHFWLRRARRLLPALFTLLIGITIYTALFRREALGQLRGDVLAALAYISNWYQIWVGQGYTASGDFSPLRHLWSLAVEEQFYLLWPLVMVGLIGLGAPSPARDEPVAVPRRRRHHRRHGAPLLPGADRELLGDAGRLLAGRRPLHLQDRRPVPRDADAGHRAAPRRGLRHALAAGRADARTDAQQGPPARRGRRRRPRRARRAVLVPAHRHPGRRRPLAVPRRVPGHRDRHAGGHRRGHPPRRPRRAVARHADPAVDRDPVLRAVPVPLADLPGHPRRGREPVVDRPVRGRRWRSPPSSPRSPSG